ncbi:MAG TPA: hypothetical protein VGN54_01220 [Mycobacteriales bacterium]|nr:hypothetical protein [Mycobacteriales bacterium]
MAPGPPPRVTLYGAGRPGPDWTSRPVTGRAATKAYRCPGCDHEIPVGQPHVVAWPLDAVHDRRHWHTACWRRAAR